MRNRALLSAVAGWLLVCGAGALCETLPVDLGFSPTAMVSASVAQTSSKRQVIDKIAVRGFCSSASSGNPALPCKLIYYALPPDADVSSVKILPGSYSTTTLPGSFDIAPTPGIATSGGMIEWGNGKSITAGRNTLVYGRNEFYPREQVRVVGVGNLRSWKVAVVEVWPYAYNPMSGKVRVVKNPSASISFTTKPIVNSSVSDPLAASMAGFIDNKEQAVAWYGSAASSPGYVIITTSAIASASTALSAFVSYQNARGFNTRIVIESEWGGGAGNAAADNIRAWLKNNAIALNVEYVLLIGNPNPASGDVPMKMLWPRRWSSSYREAPSDYYYSDLTGNWDRDGDGYAGEEPDDFGSGGIDRIPDVYVGRIPYYGSMTTLDSILRKTIEYESCIPLDWAKTFLLAMKPMDTDTQSYQLGEQITRDFIWSNGLTPDRIYDDSYNLSLPPEHLPCGYDTTQNEWTKGAGLVFWMTHGSSVTAWSVFTNARCVYLDDTKPSIVYMASCSNGQPEDTGNLGYSLLARGAITTFSASRVSWYYLGETDFTTSDSIGGLGYQYAKYLLQTDESCGRAAMDARLATPMAIWPNHLVFNLYGDPSLEYKLPKTTTQATGLAALTKVPDGAWVTVEQSVLTRMGDASECFVQDANRCTGIRVVASTPTANLQPGTKVVVTGCLATERGMRVMTQADVTVAGSVPAIRPLGMSALSVRNFRSYGLLVMIWGRVLSTSTGSFTITGANKKLKYITITCHGSATVPPMGALVKIVGISTPDGVTVCNAADVQIVSN